MKPSVDAQDPSLASHTLARRAGAGPPNSIAAAFPVYRRAWQAHHHFLAGNARLTQDLVISAIVLSCGG